MIDMIIIEKNRTTLTRLRYVVENLLNNANILFAIESL